MYNLIIVGLVGLGALVFTDNILGGVELVSFGAITGFILVNISVPVYFLMRKGCRGGRAIFNYAVLPLIATAICVYLWFNMATTAKIIGIIWLAIGIIILAIKTKGFKQLPPEMDIE